MKADVQEKGLLQNISSDIWVFVFLRGLVLLIMGALLLYKSGITVLVLVQILGAFFFVDGLFTIFKSILGRRYIEGWGWGLFVGIMEVLAGIIVFVHPFASAILTVSFLVYFIAFMAMFFGFLSIFTGIRLRKEMEGEWTMILGGLLSVIFGILLIFNPEASAVALIIVMGVFAIMGGIAQVVFAFKMRKFGKKGLAAVA